MDRIVQTKFGDQDVYLNYSIEVMFEVIEKYGDVKQALTLIGQDNKEGFAVTRHIGLMMARDGELCRRAAGHDPQPIIGVAEICERISPYDYAQFRDAVVEAIVAGYNRENKEDASDVDVGLQQLNQKKTDGAAAEQG